MSRSRYGYSPALDGVRGIAMTAFMAFHFGATAIQGAWVGINLFFVLSGFLIVRLLVEEHHRDGSISPVAFYRRRLRRLIPALLVVLAAVLAHGLLVGATGQRSRLGGDVLATLGYVMNWRLLVRDDEYFAQFDDASPLRHAWTLSIEEQFYVLVPFVIIGLLLWVRSRRARVAVLLAGAVVSAVWTAVLGLHDPATDHARLYYGTDVRAQSLFVGAALGVLLAVTPRGRRYHVTSARTAEIVGWVALAGTVASFLLVDPYAGWMFNAGGMLLLSLVSAALVLACQDPGPSRLTSLLGARPLAHAGRLSYGLYLWHWPIHLWLGPDRVGGSVLLTGAVGMVLTFVVAQLSWTYLEQPVIRRGIRGLVPSLRRPATAVAAVVPAVAVAATALVLVSSGPAADAPAGPGQAADAPFDPAGLEVPDGPVQELLPDQPSYREGSPARVGVFGDSVPHLLLQSLPKEALPGLEVTDLTLPGCDLTGLPVRYSDTLTSEPTPECLDLQADFATLLEQDDAQVLVLFASPLMLAPHVLEDGSVMTFDDPAFPDLVTDRLDTIWREAKGAGVTQMQVVNVPCRELPQELPGGEQWSIFEREPELRKVWEDPVVLNTMLEDWAKGAKGVEVVDLDGALCSGGFQREMNGQPLYADIVHFSPRSAPMLWTWLGGQASRAWEQR